MELFGVMEIFFMLLVVVVGDIVTHLFKFVNSN